MINGLDSKNTFTLCILGIQDARMPFRARVLELSGRSKQCSTGADTQRFPGREHAASRVLYYFASCVSDQMLGYIQDAEMSKEA